MHATLAKSDKEHGNSGRMMEGKWTVFENPKMCSGDVSLGSARTILATLLRKMKRNKPRERDNKRISQSGVMTSRLIVLLTPEKL